MTLSWPSATVLPAQNLVIIIQKYVLGILKILKQVKERPRAENKSKTKVLKVLSGLSWLSYLSWTKDLKLWLWKWLFIYCSWYCVGIVYNLSKWCILGMEKRFHREAGTANKFLSDWSRVIWRYIFPSLGAQICEVSAVNCQEAWMRTCKMLAM